MAPRGHNSLNAITRKFIECIARGDVVNLNEAATTLHVSKRRLYDVVNVLEGIGILEKCGMNQVRWRDELRDRNLSSELHSQCAMLQQMETDIDTRVCRLESALKRTEVDIMNSQYAYVRLQDLRTFHKFTDKTLIVVKSSAVRDIKTCVSQPKNSTQSQVKFETSGNGTLQGFLSPAGSYVHSDFEQHLFKCECSNSFNDRYFATTVSDAVIKEEVCESVDWAENGCSIRAGECNGFSVVSEVVVKEEPASRREEELLRFPSTDEPLTAVIKHEEIDSISKKVVENQSEDGFLQQQDRNADFVFFGGNNLPSTQASTVDMIYACGNPGWEMWTASVSM